MICQPIHNPYPIFSELRSCAMVDVMFHHWGGNLSFNPSQLPVCKISFDAFYQTCNGQTFLYVNEG